MILLQLFSALTLLGMAAFYFMQRRTLGRLHEAILDAQEGTLSNVASSSGCDKRVNSIVDDYNTMMNNLSAMFSTVEECQNRVVNERNKMDALLGSMPGALISVDDYLNITNINPLAAELFDCDADWLLGKMFFDVVELEPNDRDALRDAFLYKQEVKNFVIHTHINESLHYISINIAFYSKHEADLDAVITLQDITDYQRLLDSVYNREKLVAMGQMAAGIAHELNTPLGNILGYSQLLCEPSVADEKKTRYSGFVADEARRCSRIVNDLLNYARRDSCSDELCDVNALVRDMIDTFLTCRLKRQDVEIHLELQPDLPTVDIPCGELDIVLSNLLLNALHELEGKSDGVVRITSRHVGKKSLEIAIEDNGGGIPAESRRKIFEPFYTTKETGEGTGLGLSISQAMMSRRGGALSLDAKYTEGARFVIFLRGVVENE
ncbi:MAG: ATP-binding protein [Gammaproteobacteria bacterium]|nr:ATP-binding protein [Gammaproteobacteria bacterium]MCW8840345.1 ATP-binding protein [Gammaproteobacteria bacterium]MCW8959633.1 ATP-binding protein [Gammaproteobacteria bacterium]MCW8973541.1 ATP-binding protein [Gammaproteobacteria bacterium]MCW8993638.1 ATP-binding protein [Gammaproteobacteria bacterium]